MKLCRALEAEGAPIIGSSPDSIDNQKIASASRMVTGVVEAAANCTARTEDQAIQSRNVGSRVVRLLRPGGARVGIVFNEVDCGLMTDAVKVSKDSRCWTVLGFAIEVDVMRSARSEGNRRHLRSRTGGRHWAIPMALAPNSLSVVQESKRKRAARAALKVVGLRKSSSAIQTASNIRK